LDNLSHATAASAQQSHHRKPVTFDEVRQAIYEDRTGAANAAHEINAGSDTPDSAPPWIEWLARHGAWMRIFRNRGTGVPIKTGRRKSHVVL
jgi:hypothetical protein